MLKNLLKTMLLLLALVAGGGSVWADTVSFIFTGDDVNCTGVTGSVSSISYETGKTGSANATAYNTTNGLVLYGVATGGGYFNTTNAILGSITNIAITTNKKKNSPKYTVYGSTDGSEWTQIGEQKDGGSTENFATSAGYTYVKIANTTAATAQLGVNSIVITYTPAIKTLSSISVSGYKSTFYVGDTFSFGGTVSAHYDDSSTKDVTEDATFSGYNMSATGIQTVTASYGGKTTTYDITVKERPKFTVTYADDSSSDTETSVGSGVMLPVRSNPVGCSFAGWSETEIASATTTTPTLLTGTYHPSDNITLYPVYTYSTKRTSYDTEWREITAAPEDGEYVIAASTYAMKAEISSNRFANASVTIGDGKLITTPESSYIWEISKSGDYYLIKNGNKYAGGTSSKNQGALLDDGSDSHAKWTITYDTDKFVMTNYGRTQDKNDSGNAYLRNNNTSGWACYSSTQSNAPRLFKKTIVQEELAETFYITSIPPTTATITLAAACTDDALYYGTYSSSRAFTVPSTLTVSEVSVIDGELYIEDYATGDVVPANTGVLVSATSAGEKVVTMASGGTSVLGSDNMLKPSGDGGIAAADMNVADTKFYRLTMHNGSELGFWWGAEEGAAFDLVANKAYLAVPSDASVRGFSLTTDDVDGVAIIHDSSKNDAAEPIAQFASHNDVFDLSGRRVQKPIRGLYIKGGKKVVVK